MVTNLCTSPADQWTARSIYTVLLNEFTKERVRAAIHAADAQLLELAATNSKYMHAVFLYPTNLPLFNLCAKRFASFPRPPEWDQPGSIAPGTTIALRPLPFRFMRLEEVPGASTARAAPAA